MQRLAAQQMEVLRRRRAVGDADVALGTEREETLEPCTRVLGSLAFVAMGQQQREPRRLAPFRQPGDQELVDDHFGAVGEIAELRFPKRSEEHTSELQSRLHLVCRLLLEKKKRPDSRSRS